MWLTEEALKELDTKPHWWSGFPGGYCMFCGEGSQTEQCLADACPHWCVCAECGESRPNEICDGEPGHKGFTPCPIHIETECLVQGERRREMAAKYKLPEYV